jgi:N-acetyl-anhydromuramoyl-L-alanine amidase
MLEVDEAGVIAQCRQVVSPNCDARPVDTAIDLVVIHNISLPPGEFGGGAIEALFTNTLDHDAHPYYAGLKALRVSAHFLIRRGGETIQFVPCEKRAWHAGQSVWQGRQACNDFSVGIELEGTDELPFTDAQYSSLNALLAALKARYPIAGIAGHSDIAPSRKTDPGPHFEWPRIRGT